MTAPDPPRRCGTCTWWSKERWSRDVGRCCWPVPKMPAVADSVKPQVEHIEHGYRMQMFAHYGTTCPTWSARPASEKET